MKKLFSLFFILLTIISLNSQSTNSFNHMNLAWDPSPSPDVVCYTLYYKSILQTNFSSTNVLGTNTSIEVVPGIMYEFYVTARNADDIESDSSNMIRGQNIFINGVGKSTYFTIQDSISSNIPNFQLINTTSNGIVSLSLPNVIYTLTNSIGKDTLVFKSPEIYMGINITSYVSLYKPMRNAPILSIVK